jgi:nucleotide-binding universal stress UspA family protein
MYRKILIAYNGTPESRFALHECVRLAPGPETEIHLVVVVTPPPYLLVGEYAAAAVLTVEEGLATEKAKMAVEIEAGRALLADAGLFVITHLKVGEPVEVIPHLANSLGVDLAIVGHSRQKPWALRWWRGSMDTVLVEKMRCSLLVAADPVRPAQVRSGETTTATRD